MNDRSISIIIQGPIIEKSDFNGFSTFEALQSARLFYPQSEIIYSGWEGTSLPDNFNKYCNKVILSKDPGKLKIGYHNDKPIYENTNRQIISTLAGLKASTNEICIKSRSDTRFERRVSFEFHKTNDAFFFSAPIIISQCFTRLHFFEYGGYKRCIAHLSDLINIGYKEDMLKYWDGVLIQPMETNYNNLQIRPQAEQLLFIRFLINNRLYNVKTSITSKFQLSIGDMDYKVFKEFISHNFNIKNENELGMKLPARFERSIFEKNVFVNQEMTKDSIGHNGFFKKTSFIGRNVMTVMIFSLKNILKNIIGISLYKYLYNKIPKN